MTNYADLMQDLLDALTRLSRDHLPPNRLFQHLGTRQSCPIGALASLEPLEIINLIPLVILLGVVVGSLCSESALWQSRCGNDSETYVAFRYRCKTHACTILNDGVACAVHINVYIFTLVNTHLSCYNNNDAVRNPGDVDSSINMACDDETL